MKQKTTAAPPVRVQTVEQFCEAHSISRAFFNKLCKQGQAPDLIRVGRRVLISDEAAGAWRSRHTVVAGAVELGPKGAGGE
jgi:predicted DNA-binding transcriptional regulator AlpA